MAEIVTGSDGEKRPADPAAAAVLVAKISIGESKEHTPCRSFTLAAIKDDEQEDDKSPTSPS